MKRTQKGWKLTKYKKWQIVFENFTQRRQKLGYRYKVTKWARMAYRQNRKLVKGRPWHKYIWLLSKWWKSTIFWDFLYCCIGPPPMVYWNISMLAILVLANIEKYWCWQYGYSNYQGHMKKFQPKNCPKNPKKMAKNIKICRTCQKWPKHWFK